MNPASIDEAPKAITELVLELGKHLKCQMPWEQLCKIGEFKEALPAIEQQLSQKPDDLAARLCWVQCQLALEQMPITALTTPLEEIYTPLAAADLSLPAAITFLKVAVRLLEKNQLRLSVRIFERALEFVSKCNVVSLEAADKIHDIYLQVLRNEYDRAEKRREGKEYLILLEAKIADLEKLKNKRPKVSSTSTKKSTRLSAKSIFAESSSVEVNPMPVEIPLTAEDTSGEVNGLSPSSARTTANQTDRNLLKMAVVVLLCVVSGLAIWWKVTAPNFGLILARAEIHAETVSVPQTILPAVEARGRESSLSSNPAAGIEALNERLRKMSDVPSQSAGAVQDPSAPATSENAQPKTIEEYRLQEEDNKIENSTAFGKQAENRDTSKSPNAVNIADLAGTVVEHLNSSPRQTAIEGLNVGPDGRIYGPPVDGTSGGGREMPRGIDGKPIQAFEVEQFDKPVLYHTITKARVFSAPSLVSVTVATLDENATIQVVSRMGQWLELRSSGGKRGYIFAQDAEKLR